MKCTHLADVCKAGFHCNSGLFIFGLRFCSLNCIKPATIIPPVRFCIVAVHIIFIERYLLHSMSLRANKIINNCSENKSENFLMICHKWELRFEDFLIILVTIEPLLVLIEYVPYGDLLGYLRKSRGLNDTYFKDPDMKPQTNLTAEQLMKFAWQVADGMCYLSSKKVCFKCDFN